MGNVRQGTGKIIKYFMDKTNGDTISKLNAEIEGLTDDDVCQLAGGIEDGSLTYSRTSTR
jgi:hypothetical protein